MKNREKNLSAMPAPYYAFFCFIILIFIQNSLSPLSSGFFGIGNMGRPLKGLIYCRICNKSIFKIEIKKSGLISGIPIKKCTWFFPTDCSIKRRELGDSKWLLNSSNNCQSTLDSFSFIGESVGKNPR